jgi:hypothetical protein
MTDRNITIFWRVCVALNLFGCLLNCGLFAFGHGLGFLALGIVNGWVALLAQGELERHYKL